MTIGLFDDFAIDKHLRSLSLNNKSPPSKPPRRQILETIVHYGIVKMFSERGFGFIKPDNGDPDVFVHVSAVTAAGLRDLQPGDRVEFTLVEGRNGRSQAGDLRLLDAEAA